MRCPDFDIPAGVVAYYRKPGPNPATAKRPTQNNRSLLIQANQMRCVLVCIDANGADDYSVCLHGDVLLVLRSPYRNPLGAGARPVHPILPHRRVGGPKARNAPLPRLTLYAKIRPATSSRRARRAAYRV